MLFIIEWRTLGRINELVGSKESILELAKHFEQVHQNFYVGNHSGRLDQKHFGLGGFVHWVV